MKKYLILFLLLVSSLVTKSQTCSLDYVNIRFGIDKTLKESSFINNNFGVQVGSFFTDMWGAELDVQKGIKHNGLSNFSIGTNLIYQYTNYDINITPFVKIGGAYKNYSFDENIEKDKCKNLY